LKTKEDYVMKQLLTVANDRRMVFVSYYGSQ